MNFVPSVPFRTHFPCSEGQVVDMGSKPHFASPHFTRSLKSLKLFGAPEINACSLPHIHHRCYPIYGEDARLRTQKNPIQKHTHTRTTMLIHILFQKQKYLYANIRAHAGITQLHRLDILDARVDPLPQRNLLHFVSAVFCSARAQWIPSVAGAAVGPPWGHRGATVGPRCHGK